MPTKPDKTYTTMKSTMQNNIALLNAVRSGASYTYQQRIPMATQENIKQIADEMYNYKAVANEFIDTLINRIALVMVTSKSYENPYRRFKKGKLEYGETIEEIFVNIIKAHEFDPVIAEKEVFKREIPNVDTVFHRLNLQNFYKVTISHEELRMAFLSASGLFDLVTRIVEALNTSMEFDEFLTMKQLIIDGVKQGKFYPVQVTAGTTNQDLKLLVSEIKGVSNSLEFMTGKYNYLGVATHTKKNKQVLFVDSKYDALIDVEVLASAFNMSKAEFMGQRVLIDDFADLTGVVAVLVDEDYFMVFDNNIWFTDIYNAQGLYWNYFLHVWKTFSTSPFANAVVFTTSDISTATYTLSPQNASVAPGNNIQFAVTSSVIGASTSGSYEVTRADGTLSTNTKINDEGLLKVGVDEAKGQLTVTWTSAYNTTETQTATVEVV